MSDSRENTEAYTSVTSTPFNYFTSTSNRSDEELTTQNFLLTTSHPNDEITIPAYNLPYMASEVIVAVLAVTGNALVVFVFCTNRSLRRYRNYYIVGLAVADFLVGLLGIPLAVMTNAGHPRNLYGCLFSVSTLLVLCTISILCLVAVSVDRYWATTNPFAYYRNMTTSTAVGIIVSCWVVGTLIGFLPLLGWYNAEGWMRKEECYFVHVISYSYLVFLYFATIVFPSILMAAFYGYIYHVVLIKIRQKGTLVPQGRRQSQSSRSGSLNSETRGATQMMRIMQSEKRREAKAAKKLGIIVLFFMVCWMPLYTINCIQAFVTVNVPGALMDFTIILSHANSALNPLLYAYHLKEFRLAMKNALCALFGCLSCGCIEVPDPKDNMGAVSRSQTIPSLANASLNTQTGKFSINFRKNPGGGSRMEGGAGISPRRVGGREDDSVMMGRRSNGRNFLGTPSSDNLYHSAKSDRSPASLSLIHGPLTSTIPIHYSSSSNHYNARRGLEEEHPSIRSMYDISGDPSHMNFRPSACRVEEMSPRQGSTLEKTMESVMDSQIVDHTSLPASPVSVGRKSGVLPVDQQDTQPNSSPGVLGWKNSPTYSLEV